MARMYFPQYRRGRDGVEIFDGTILEHARKVGAEVASECGGMGTCGRCVVRIDKGADGLNDRTAVEEKHPLARDERLSCQARPVTPDSDIHVYIRDFGDYSILSDSLETDVALAPTVRREGDRVVHADAGDLGPYAGEIYGLAIDIGTTTIVTEVLDLEDGRSLGTLTRKNPQILFGNDVISRIGHSMQHEDGLQQLRQGVAQAINEDLTQLEKRTGAVRRYVYDVVVVGNSTMREIFFGRDVASLGVIPYEPGDLLCVHAKATDLGLAVASACRAYGGPLIGGHAGADAVADIVACGMHRDDAVNMLIDIGTNGEVAVGNRDRIMTASCAAGGAYEGATVTCGVGAIAGAIKNVRIRDGHVDFATIADKAAVGICGSGLIDLLAEMLQNRIMSRQARIDKPFHLTDSISITQQDIYQLITAKAGLRADQDLLMKYYGVGVENIGKIYLSGAFGNFISPENAAAIGLLPHAPGKTVRVGNAALAGARAMLLSREARMDAETVAAGIEHVKPNEREEDFAYIVADRMYF
jgi:uncharacterized 2Fe-2S/4Fe-4S cluster protein (DUF4445 family)